MTTSKSKLQLTKKANESLRDSLKACSICPRKCGVDRTKGKRGYCRAPFNPVVYSYSAHHGEEPVLSGKRGSGTIFFSHCNMKCVYCQNHNFSQQDRGEEISTEKLSRMMLHLQKIGCHNINLVTATHFVPQILSSLEIALREGLKIPIVYNTSGYELADTVRLLEGIMDIYLPDMRYSDNKMAMKYSYAPDYVEHNRAGVKEMHRQVGDLVVDDHGIAEKGLIIRLLALPCDVSGTDSTLKFIRDEIGQNTYLSLMSQYYPTFKAHEYKEISRGVTRREYQNIVDAGRLLGLNNGWIQERSAGPDNDFVGTKIEPKTEIE